MATEQDLQDFTTQVTCPDDFDEFWAGTLEMLSGISLNPLAAAAPLPSNYHFPGINCTSPNL